MSYVDLHDKNQSGYSDVGPVHNRRKEVDIHEELKKEMYKQSGLPNPATMRQVGAFPNSAVGGAGSVAPFSALVPTAGTNDGVGSKKGGIVDRFFLLDSSAKDSSSSLSVGKIVFDIQTLNQSKPIDNIIEMEIGDFFFPEIASNLNYPTYFFFRRLLILIEQMAAQSIFAQGNYRAHFIVGAQPAGISNSSTEIGSSKFIFGKPFRDLGSASFRFMKPSFSQDFSPVVFDQDIFTFTAVAGAPTGPDFGGAEIITSIPHGLVDGTDVSIFIKDFASNVANIDVLVNSPEGLLVRVHSPSTLEFRAPGTVGFDFTSVAGGTSGQLLIGFRRISFTMRFRCLSSEETNTIVPV